MSVDAFSFLFDEKTNELLQLRRKSFLLRFTINNLTILY
jgi:hypothetical protein